jgi:hypothetical protein
MKKTEKALGTLLDVASLAINSYTDDGKIDWGESINIAFKAVGIVSIVKDLPEIKEELKAGVTSEEITALVEVFKDKFDLPNDELETKIEQGVEVLANMALMVFSNEEED